MSPPDPRNGERPPPMPRKPEVELERFERLYSRAVMPDSAPILQALREKRLQAGAAPAEPWALGGCVLTPSEQIDPGWVVVESDQIKEVLDAKPEGVRALDTQGVVLPGLIDLHNHPDWNVLPPWEPPALYSNRYEWQKDDKYKKVVEAGYNTITIDPPLLRDAARYAEFRALVGGTTAIQGGYESLNPQLVRKVELAPFGVASARAMVKPLMEEESALDRLRNEIDTGNVTAFYAHVAEGVDEESRKEFDEFVDKRLLTPATIIIHGTALTQGQLEQTRDAGAKLVWSPQSNLRLFGETTHAALVRELRIPMGIGADWIPSGSVGLLAELQVARRILDRQQPRKPVLAIDLVEMVTKGAAEIADLAEYIGRIAPGLRADLVVLERLHDDPYEAVLRAGRSSVRLVAVDGKLVYGRDGWFGELAAEGPTEEVWAWGSRMQVAVAAHQPGQAFPASLESLKDLRAVLTERFPRLGPIFA